MVTEKIRRIHLAFYSGFANASYAKCWRRIFSFKLGDLLIVHPKIEFQLHFQKVALGFLTVTTIIDMTKVHDKIATCN